MSVFSQRPVFAVLFEQERQNAGVLFHGESPAKPALLTAPETDTTSKVNRAASLIVQLKKQLTITGTPAEQANMDKVLAKLMESQTALGLAQEFIDSKAEAKIAFCEIPGTKIITENGRKTFITSGGYADAQLNPPQICLNNAFQVAETEYAPTILAHEMFGHTLEKYKAAKYGVDDIYLRDQNDEANAALIQWTVSKELGNKPDDSWVWFYLDDPADYHNLLKTNLPYYASTLTIDQMKNPLIVFKQRLASTNQAITKLPAEEVKTKKWYLVIDHLVQNHNMADQDFNYVRGKIATRLEIKKRDYTDLNDIKEHLGKWISFLEGANGPAWEANLRAKADSPYFKVKADAIAKRTERLEFLFYGPQNQATGAPPAVGQITWDELEKLRNEDKCGVLK